MFPTTLRDLSTSLYVVLKDCVDQRSRLCSQPHLRTCWTVSTLCSGTVLTTEHVYVSNHARGLVDQSLRCARGLLRSLFDHSLWTALLSYIWIELTQLRGDFNFLDLTTRLILCLPASSKTTSVRCTWRCISILEFLHGLFLDPSTTCLRHLLPGSGTKWAYFTLRWICLLCESLYF